jgi:isopenicillin N synthase-like dioxygenase
VAAGYAQIPSRDDSVLRRDGGDDDTVGAIVAMALDLPADYFAEAFAEPNCTIRLIHYPTDLYPEENEFGFAPHTDNNFLTFLAQSTLPGLEVRTAEGEWIQPPAVPSTFVVNTGAMLARCSIDRFRATPHRVITAMVRRATRSPSSSRRTTFDRGLRPNLRRTRYSRAAETPRERAGWGQRRRMTATLST